MWLPTPTSRIRITFMTSTPPIQAWAAGTGGLIYENSLIGLSDVLGEANVEYWQRWIDEDLRLWRARGDTCHHEQAHGGMGSLNDVALWDRPWQGGAFEQLRHLAGLSTQAVSDDPSRFVQFPGVGPSHLHFYRCETCRSRFVDQEAIDWTAATGWASYTVPRLVRSGEGSAVLPSVKGEALPDDRPIYRKFVESNLSELGLQRHEVHSKSPCPTCGEINWYRKSLPVF